MNPSSGTTGLRASAGKQTVLTPQAVDVEPGAGCARQRTDPRGAQTERGTDIAQVRRTRKCGS